MEPLNALGVHVLPLDVTDDESMRAAVGRVLSRPLAANSMSRPATSQARLFDPVVMLVLKPVAAR
ncbi:MAG TPA: hypothetical protein VJ617_06115 [Arthrobacter sp.]|nr:hypothetical protein [Arthrobacter sp.]